ncbi:MAG: phosphotransferase family protein [Nocardioides sp.]
MSGDGVEASRARYALVLGRAAEDLEVRSGQSADVLLARDEVWRFPRTPDALARMVADAERLRRARAGGLPAPSVVEVVDGPAGTARVQLTRLRGTPLPECGTLGAAAVTRLAGDLAAALESLARLPLDGLTDGGWAEHWEGLAVSMHHLLSPRMSAAGQRAAAIQLDRATRAAHGAPTAAVHGDLGASHLFVDPQTGRLLGIADWDTLAAGDPVVDLAALRATLPAAVWDALLRVRPLTEAEQERMDAYAATFALQDALLSARAGDDESADRALSGYR